MPFYMKEVCSYANRSIPGRISPLRCAGCPRHDRHFMLHSRGHLFVAKGTGSLGLAALNIAIPAYNLMNGLGLMVGVGGATHYLLCRAQGDAAEADRTFTHTLLLGLCIALVFVLTGTFGVVPLSRLLGANAETLDMTAVYLRLLLCFAPFFVTNNIMIAFVRNDGEPGRAMAGMIAGSLFNIVFDWVFIFPCGLGMFGAALATGASPLVSLLVLSGHLRRPSRGFPSAP